MTWLENAVRTKKIPNHPNIKKTNCDRLREKVLEPPIEWLYHRAFRYWPFAPRKIFIFPTTYALQSITSPFLLSTSRISSTSHRHLVALFQQRYTCFQSVWTHFALSASRSSSPHNLGFVGTTFDPKGWSDDRIESCRFSVYYSNYSTAVLWYLAQYQSDRSEREPQCLEEVGRAESFFMWATMAFNEDGSTLRRGKHAEYDEWALNTTSIRLFQLRMTFFVASVSQIPCSIISNSFTLARVKIRADMLFFMHAHTFVPSFVNSISIWA